MKTFVQSFLCLLTLLVLSNCASVQNQPTIIQPNMSTSTPGVMVKVISATQLKGSNGAEIPLPLNDGQVPSNAAQKGATLVQNESQQTQYQVVFEFKGQTFSTQLPFDPGEYLLIQDTPPQKLNSATASTATSTGNLTYVSNDLYILPPVGLNLYPSNAYGFFTAFPVYFSGGYYHRLPGRFNLNHGNHIHLNSGAVRARGRK